MLALQYGSEFLDLADPESVVTRWVSTAFNDSDKLLGSGSELSFELANTPANSARLGYADQLANRLARTDIEVVIWIFGMPWKRCLFSFSLKDGRIRGYTKIDNGEFADVIKEKTLPQAFITTKNGAFVDHDWIFVGNSYAETVSAVNDSLTPGAAPYTFYPYINTAIFGDYSGEEGEQQWEQPRVINRWHAGGFQTQGAGEDLKTHWYSPSLYLVWVIRKVCTYLGYEAVGDLFDDPEIIYQVIDNNSIYSETDVFGPDGWKIAPARQLPSIKLNEFFKQMREQWRIIYYFDSDTRQAHFGLSETVLSSPERIDLEGCIEKGRPTTDPIDETGFELVQGIDSDDELFKVLPYVKSFFIGGDRVQKEVKVPIATCFMRRELNSDSSDNAIWRVPMKKQVGNAYSDRAVDSSAYNPEDYGRNNFAFRLLSYRGMIADSQGNAYPYAVSDGLAPDETTEICSSLWLGGDNGILERYHRKWYTFFIRTELTELRTYITADLLCRLSPLKKIRFATTEGVHLEAFLDEVKFRVSNDLKLRADLRIYPNYNLAAADETANADFASGDVVNEAVVYVKMYAEEYDRDYRRPFLGSKQLYWISENYIAEFFSDAAGTIPVSVNGLVLTLIRENTKNGSFSTGTIRVACYGEQFIAFERSMAYFHKGNKTETQKFILADGEGYFKIS